MKRRKKLRLMSQILISKNKHLKIKLIKLTKEDHVPVVTLFLNKTSQAGKGKPIGSLSEARRQALTNYRLTNLHLSTCFARSVEIQAQNKVWSRWRSTKRCALTAKLNASATTTISTRLETMYKWFRRQPTGSHLVKEIRATEIRKGLLALPLTMQPCLQLWL